MARPRTPKTPFYRFNSSPEIIRLVVMMYVKFPLSLRNVEDLLHERGIDICHETVRMWWNRFGRYCQTKCDLTAKGGLLSEIAPASAFAVSRFS
jgi:transposase-like protein